MFVEASPELESVVVALDGPAKCGKTKITDYIAIGAKYQQGADTVPLERDAEAGAPCFSEVSRAAILELRQSMRFRRITKISAGNMFRAAAFYKMQLEQQGQVRDRFVAEDVDGLREMLARPGITDVLQNNQDIGDRVTPTAKMMGVQALCGAMFCDAVLKAYQSGGGGNLVIVDARDPVGHLQRNNRLGHSEGKVNPRGILPIYVETPVEAAAKRSTTRSYEEEFAYVTKRRLDDATRKELPVTVPTDLIDDMGEWARQFSAEPVEGSGVARPLRVYNGDEVSLDNLQRTSGLIAVAAKGLAHLLHRQRLAVA